jgi:CO/xanthine dehydrogenase Mo-binding subunit
MKESMTEATPPTGCTGTDEPGAQPFDSRPRTSVVGHSIPRLDTLSQVTGELKYAGDLSFPGMLYARILRSRYPHARIIHIDTREAEALPGILATVTGKDFRRNAFGPSFLDQPVLAFDKVRHMGDGVAAVAAVDPQTAAQALDKIKVEYEPLSPVFDPFEAMEDTAPKVHEPRTNIYSKYRIQRGDVEKAFAESDRIIDERYASSMVDHMPVETHACIAAWDARNRLTVWSSLGRITLGRSDIAAILGLPLSRVRVVSTQVGGNFGGKNEITVEPVVAVLARKTGRPVKSFYTREEEFTSTTKRHPFVMDYRTGVRNDGRILARSIRLVADGGAYCSWSETTLGKAIVLSSGPYDIENLHAEAYAVYTNKAPAGAMRGFGAPQVCFAYESHMDRIARELSMNPLQIRLLNSYHEGSVSPTGQILYSVAVKETLTAASARFGWKESKK